MHLFAFLLPVFFALIPGLSTAAEFKPLQNPRGLEIAGEIQPGDAARLSRLIASTVSTGEYNLLNVVLDSPGGSVDDAMKIASMLDAWHSFTLVKPGAVCASACTLIWSAGLLRMLPPNSKLGFHRIFVRNEADTSVSSARRQIEPAGDLVAHAYRRAGLPSALIARAMETPASDVYWVDAGVSRSQRWERNLNFNPVLLDLAEQECGRETLTSRASKSQFIAWIDCADKVRMRSFQRSVNRR